MTERACLLWDDSHAAVDEWFLRTTDGRELGWICILNDWQGYVTLTDHGREVGKFETLEEAKAALEISARLRLAKEAKVKADWRTTMLGWQYNVDGEVRGWVIEDRDQYEAQTTQGGGTVLGTYATENEAKAAVMAAQEDNMTRNTAHEDDGLELQEGEPMDEETREEIEEYLNEMAEDAPEPEPAPEPAPRQRRKRSDILAAAKSIMAVFDAAQGAHVDAAYLSAKTGLPLTTIRNELQKLYKDGLLMRVGRGQYARSNGQPKVQASAPAPAKATGKGKRGRTAKGKLGTVGGVLDQVRAIKAEMADHQKAIEECEGRLAQLREALTEALEEVGNG